MVENPDLPLPENPKLAHNITYFARALRAAGLPVGPGRVVDAIKAGQWCETRLEDRSLYTETEADYLSELEEELFEAITEVPDILTEFVEDGMKGE